MSSNTDSTSIPEAVAWVHHIATFLRGLQATEQQTNTHVYIFNHPTESVTAIHVNVGSNTSRPLPASPASVAAMRRITVLTEESIKKCVICLDEIGVGGEIREMPCKHGFHSCCIEKWLGIHGSCPVCRYMMPVKDSESGGNGGDEGIQRQRRVILLVHDGTGSESASLVQLPGLDQGPEENLENPSVEHVELENPGQQSSSSRASEDVIDSFHTQNNR